MARRRIPSLNWLRVFEAAARTGSFARAAAALHMSPPAVSQQIRALETQLGKDLFIRGPSSVTLTEAGRAFLPFVAQSLHTVEVGTASLFADRGTAVVSVRCTLLFACGWLAPRLPAFRAAHPDIKVVLLSGLRDEDFGRQGDDLSVAFGIAALPGQDSDPLFGEMLYPVASPQIAAQIETPADLLRFPLVEIATHRANWFALLPAGGPEPRFTFTDNTVNGMAMAAAGAIALAREPASGALPERYGLVRCLPDLSVAGVQSYTLLYRARRELSSAAQAFRTWLLQEVAQTGQEHPSGDATTV